MAPRMFRNFWRKANSGNYFSFTVVRHPFERLVLLFYFFRLQEIIDNLYCFFRVVDRMAPKSVQELLETANSGNYFSFTVVRHPFDRLVSAYRDRILHGCTDQAKYHIPQIFSLTRRRLILLGRENQVMEFLGFINLVKTNLMKLFSNIHQTTYTTEG